MTDREVRQRMLQRSEDDLIRIDVLDSFAGRQYQISARDVPSCPEYRPGFMIDGIWFEVIATITDQIDNEVLSAIIEDRERQG